MATMPQFVCQRQNIVLFAGKIKHQIRMRGIHRRTAKSPATLTVTWRYIYPIIIKEIFGYFIELRRKLLIRIQNRFYGFFPSIMNIRTKRQRGISVPIADFINTQPLSFQLIKAMRNIFVVFFYGFCQHFHTFITHIFAHIARRNRCFKSAFFIFYCLIFHYHVIDKSIQMRICQIHSVHFLTGSVTQSGIFIQ